MAAEKKDEFEAASARICSHMNDDHSPSVLGMALTLWPEARRASMVALKRDEVVIVATGEGRVEKRTLSFALDPPLAAVSDARPRLVVEHHKALAPACDQPAGGLLAVVVPVVFLAAWTDWAVFSPVRFLADAAFPVPECLDRFAKFTLVAHGFEALYAAYLARGLKMGAATCARWAALTLVVGFAALGRLVRLSGAKPVEAAAKQD